MDADVTKLQHKSPKVLVLGDSILDLFVYDKRAEAADFAPLSRDDWCYAPGFETRLCVAGAAAIQAMLSKNAIHVDGNSFRNGGEQRALEKSGSMFILRQKSQCWRGEEEKVSRDTPGNG